MLKGALRVSIVDIERRPQETRVTVEVENRGAGHMIPTGMPNRKLVLTVEVKTDRQVYSDNRVYEKIVIDQDRKILTEESEILIRGREIIKDNRIAPREKRRETFIFPVPLEERISTQARIAYLYEPCILKKEEIKVELATDHWEYLLESRFD